MYMYVHCWKNTYSQVHVHVHVLHMYYNVHVHVSAIQFLQDTNDFQQAEQILNKVVQIEPDNPLGHFSLGSVDMYICQGCTGSVVCTYAYPGCVMAVSDCIVGYMYV